MYKNGVLHAEDVALPAIAQVVGTPAFVYSASAMAGTFTAFADAFADVDALVCYALKANANLAVVRTLSALGAGADVVSVGELVRAREAGIPAGRIVFAGVGKTREEMAAGLQAGIFQFNVESEPELHALSQVAAAEGVDAPVSIRVNPDVDAQTHAKITTGRKENKFGIPWQRAHDIYALAAQLPNIAVKGVAVHIGSQLTSLAPFEAAYRRVGELVVSLRAAGHRIERLDLGGGLGIVYADETPPSLAEYRAIVARTVGHLDVRLAFEPGRMIVGNAGILLSRVLYVKDEGRRFVIVDAAMNDLIRPSLYDAWHDVVPVAQPAPGAPDNAVDLVGPICESGDILANNRLMPPLAPGDLIAIRSVGAYAAVMASTYNGRPLLPEVLVRGSDFATVRKRQSLEAMFADEALPPWLDEAAARGVA